MLVAAVIEGLAMAPLAAQSAGDYPSIQDAVDRNPGRMVYVPAGNYVIERAIHVTTANSGVWGPGRIVQSNPDEAIVEIEGAARARVSGLTLTRSPGRMETHRPGLHVSRSPEAVVDNVSVIDNWTDDAALLVENCAGVQVRGCTIRNYYRLGVDDRTRRPDHPDYENHGYAFNCINGTGLDFRNVTGGLAEGNRIIELRLLPTPQIKETYQLGKIIKKDRQKGILISQENWDANYVNLWRQGAALHVGTAETSDFIQILGNYIENSQQGCDVHADHAIVANNIVIDAPHGIKAMHGSRNLLIIGNQFLRNDLFGIGLMQGTLSHVAGRLPNRGPSPASANIDGDSIIAHNIISDFGFGMSHWIWPVGDHIGPAPIQLGGRALPDTPPLRDIIVDGNLVCDPGRDKILVNNEPRLELPRYRYAVRIEDGAAAPQGLHFSNNILSPGLDGVSTGELVNAPN